MADPDRPNPLDYHNPTAQGVPEAARPGWVILGGTAGVAATILAGCGGMELVDPNNASRYLLAGGMAAASALCWTRLALGPGNGRGRYFFIGFLIGAGLMTLIEGACFTVIR